MTGIGWRDPMAIRPGADGWRRRKHRDLPVVTEFCVTCSGRGETFLARPDIETDDGTILYQGFVCPTCEGSGNRWVTA